ncbi:GNAT family N-acetyltransferase [Paenibacillus chibensis]|uniref:GNAT family N-acetyltransferase n=1 Tax=Paenibacillus chibensis TaxID=59846 RepID=UPI000FDCB9CF|nr:GNAT family N-acetyltransferase [Paenibacillus chibensis]MEC0371608.1 GNAT family N-acetyltransferase [Paenibacillus chibensis]
MQYTIRQMTIRDYDPSIELWKRTEGMGLSEADSREAIMAYLERNPEMSFVCLDEERIIGTILCGHDGRRGFIYHLAVDAEYRGRSIATRLVENSLSMLERCHIDKCHLLVIADNELGNHFWSQSGWQRREGLFLYSKSIT